MLSGIQKEYPESNETSENSTAWRNGGNPRWQAPELFEGSERTTSTDIFAFGRVIYEVWRTLYYLLKALTPPFVGVYAESSIWSSPRRQDRSYGLDGQATFEASRGGHHRQGV